MNMRNDATIARLSEDEFNRPDGDNPRYSLAEYDFYGHLPYSELKKGIDNHRLSLRKDLTTKKYQIYAHYWRTIRRAAYDEVFYESTDMRAAFNYGAGVARNKWGGDFKLELDIVRPFGVSI